MICLLWLQVILYPMNDIFISIDKKSFIFTLLTRHLIFPYWQTFNLSLLTHYNTIFRMLARHFILVLLANIWFLICWQDLKYSLLTRHIISLLTIHLFFFNFPYLAHFIFLCWKDILFYHVDNTFNLSFVETISYWSIDKHFIFILLTRHSTFPFCQDIQPFLFAKTFNLSFLQRHFIFPCWQDI